MAREQMTPWEIERENPSPDDLDAGAAFFDRLVEAGKHHYRQAAGGITCMACRAFYPHAVRAPSGPCPPKGPVAVEVDGVVVAVTTRKELT